MSFVTENIGAIVEIFAISRFEGVGMIVKLPVVVARLTILIFTIFILKLA